LLGRRIGGVVAGLLIAFAIVMATELIPHKLYPPPAGFDQSDFTQVKTYVATLPMTALVIVLAGWLVATIAGSSVAAGIGKSRVPAYVVGALLLGAGVYNALVIPQPVWFSAVSLVIYIVGAMIGARIAVPRRGNSGPLSSSASM
jgi:hypothetical protein